MKNGFVYCFKHLGDLAGLREYLGSSSLFGLDAEAQMKLREDMKMINGMNGDRL